MSDRNVKIHRNPDREKPTAHAKYVPQYKIRGIEPEEIKSSVVPEEIIGKTERLPLTNPRAPRQPIRQPYAKVIPSPVGRGRDLVPNVGNNMEHTWSSVDGEIIDDLSPEMDMRQSMIDNNDMMTGDALGYRVTSFPEKMDVDDSEVYSPPKHISYKGSPSVSSIIDDIEEDDYILLVNGITFSSGSLEDIQKDTKMLIFGDYPDMDCILPEKLVVLKRVKVKIGVFLE